MTAVQRKTEIRAYGLRLLLSAHPEVRRLKRKYTPSVHGNKTWSTSWLLIDHLRRTGLKSGAKVLEIGCGWGLTGIYCAKKFDAAVTAVDIDAETYPYLDLHARVNRVQVEFINTRFEKVGHSLLHDVDLMVGSDICFWDELVDPLRRLVQRARRCGVRQILIADPGRPTFDRLVKTLKPKKAVQLLEREIRKPRPIAGQILKIGGGP